MKRNTNEVEYTVKYSTSAIFVIYQQESPSTNSHKADRKVSRRIKNNVVSTTMSRPDPKYILLQIQTIGQV